jgi:hypothetical protein
MRDVIDARDLDAHEDRAWNGRFSFHDAVLAGYVAGCGAAPHSLRKRLPVP